MKKYRVDDEEAPSGDDRAKPDSQITNPWQLYVADIEDQGDVSISEQTIEEEYAAYVASVPKRQIAVDPVKFWEVCDFSVSCNSDGV